MSAAAHAAGVPLDERFEMVVGLEVHVQLATRTKIFCRCSAAFGAPPNANSCPVCLGLPGALPALNGRVVELAVRAALALDCTIHSASIFARKNYFYPDLPKGYQISQFDRPLATGGRVAIGGGAAVRVTRVHIEEDAGKSIHDRFAAATAVDLNRAGVPLIEIVSEPDIRTVEDSHAYLTALKRILEYSAVSDVSMERGSLRVDANVSARRRGESRLGTKTEIKNLNSFSGVGGALEAEFARQCAVLDAGGRVEQETMIWDANVGQVRAARLKEGSHDYRYFPDPDLPPLVVTRERIDAIRRAMPELPDARRARFETEYSMLGAKEIERLTSSPRVAEYFEQVARQSDDAKAAANWMTTEVPGALNATGQSIEHFTVRPADLAALIRVVRDGTVSHSAAKQVFAAMVKTGDTPSAIAKREGLLKVSDGSALTAWVEEVLAESPEEAARFIAGERRLLGVLVGKVMKKSNGSADPKRVNQLLAARVVGGK